MIMEPMTQRMNSSGLDVLTDNQHLYCIMPYCDGGELLDVLQRLQKFSEEEARY